MVIGPISTAHIPSEGQGPLRGGNKDVADLCSELLETVQSFGSDQMTINMTWRKVQAFCKFLLGIYPPNQFPEVNTVTHEMNMAFINYVSNHDVTTLKDTVTRTLQTVMDILHKEVIPPCPGPYQESLSNEIRWMFFYGQQVSNNIHDTPKYIEGIKGNAQMFLGEIWLFDSLPEGREINEDSGSLLAKMKQTILDVVADCYMPHPSIEDIKATFDGNPPESIGVVAEMKDIQEMLNSGNYPWYIPQGTGN